MTPEETLAQTLKEQTKTQIEDAIKTATNESELKMNAVKLEAETLKADIVALAEKLKQAETKAVENSFEKIKSQLEAKKEQLMSLRKGQKLQIEFTVKTDPGNMTFANSITGEIPQMQRITGFNPIAVRLPFLRNIINAGQATSNEISWVEEVAGNGDAGYTTEGDTKNKADGAFKTDSEKVVKLTIWMKVSEEMLEDIDFMASWINNKLLQKLNIKLDAEILSGAGGGAALNGIVTQATAWAAGSFAHTVIAANQLDVLRIAVQQIITANHIPNVILLNPIDITKLALTKDKNENYLFPSVMLPTGQIIDGISVIQNNGVPVGTFVVMDSTKATLYVKNDTRVEVGYDGNDFTKNMRTVLAEMRCVLVIEGNDKTAFVKGTFATCITDLSTQGS